MFSSYVFELQDGALILAGIVNDDVGAERWAEAIATAATALGGIKAAQPFTHLMLRAG